MSCVMHVQMKQEVPQGRQQAPPQVWANSLRTSRHIAWHRPALQTMVCLL